MTFTTMPPSLLMPGGQDIDLFPMPSELTVAQAARILCMSDLKMSERRLNDILDEGNLEFRLENGERLISVDTLFDYIQMRKSRQAWLDEMAREDQEMGLYDMEYNLEEYNATRNAIREENRRA